MSGAIVRRHFDFLFGCFVFDPVSFAFQMVLFGLYLSFFIIGGKKDAVCVSLTHVFWITADREIGPFSFWCKPISPNWLGRTILYKAFVRFRLLMIWYSIPFSAKETTQPRLAQILRKILAKTSSSRRHEQSIPPIMKNERPNTQRNLLKRVRYRPEHKAPKQKIEVAISDLHRNSATYIAPNPRQPNIPPQRFPGVRS